MFMMLKTVFISIFKHSDLWSLYQALFCTLDTYILHYRKWKHLESWHKMSLSFRFLKIALISFTIHWEGAHMIHSKVEFFFKTMLRRFELCINNLKQTSLGYWAYIHIKIYLVLLNFVKVKSEGSLNRET